jgi:hypothetical protein
MIHKTDNKGHFDGSSCRKALIILNFPFVGVFAIWYYEFRLAAEDLCAYKHC